MKVYVCSGQKIGTKLKKNPKTPCFYKMPCLNLKIVEENVAMGIIFYLLEKCSLDEEPISVIHHNR